MSIYRRQAPQAFCGQPRSPLELALSLSAWALALATNQRALEREADGARTDRRRRLGAQDGRFVWEKRWMLDKVDSIDAKPPVLIGAADHLAEGEVPTCSEVVSP